MEAAAPVGENDTDAGFWENIDIDVEPAVNPVELVIVENDTSDITWLASALPKVTPLLLTTLG